MWLHTLQCTVTPCSSGNTNSLDFMKSDGGIKTKLKRTYLNASRVNPFFKKMLLLKLNKCRMKRENA